VDKKIVKFEILKSFSEDNVGVVEGYASTFGNVDRDGDVIEKGAFTKSIKKFKTRNQKIPMLSGHSMDKLIGGFDPSKLKEDDKGLYVVGEIDLDTQEGRENYSLLKKGFLDSFSVGFNASSNDVHYKDGVPHFTNLDLLEISTAPIPANQEAMVTAVKGATGYKNYSLMPDDTAWDKDKAVSQIRVKTGSEDSPSATYKDGFMWYDSSNPDDFGSYKLPYVYVVDGEFKAVPKAISSIQGALSGARGGVNIPASDKSKIQANVNKYMAKMDKSLDFGKIDGIISKMKCDSIDKLIGLFNSEVHNDG
jgi:HK97 family phage prohead protease